jgi:hypothetical protein
MYSKEEEKKLRLEFWTSFGRWCKLAPQLKGRKKSFILHHTGIADIALKFETTRREAVVMVELSQSDEGKRLHAFEVLEKYKPMIEKGFPDGLVWDFYAEKKETGKEVCRIYTDLSPADYLQKKYWPAIFNFFIDNMTILERNFLEISEILLEELKEDFE